MNQIIEKYEEFNCHSPTIHSTYLGMIDVALRPDEAVNLTCIEKEQINYLFNNGKDVFEKMVQQRQFSSTKL